MLKITSNKGNVIPFLLIALVAFSLIGFLWAGFSDTYSQNHAQQVNSGITFPSLNNTAFIGGVVSNVSCGGDIVCNLGNIYTLMEVNSSDPLFTILIISPMIAILGVIVIWWIRGVSL